MQLVDSGGSTSKENKEEIRDGKTKRGRESDVEQEYSRGGGAVPLAEGVTSPRMPLSFASVRSVSRPEALFTPASLSGQIPF